MNTKLIQEIIGQVLAINASSDEVVAYCSILGGVLLCVTVRPVSEVEEVGSGMWKSWEPDIEALYNCDAPIANTQRLMAMRDSLERFL